MIYYVYIEIILGLITYWGFYELEDLGELEKSWEQIGRYRHQRYLDRKKGYLSPTDRVLYYIDEYGTTSGASGALDIGPAGFAQPISKLLRLGYIERVGLGKYGVTEAGKEYLRSLS